MSRKRVVLEKKSAKPLHDQIYEAVRNDLLAGIYKTGQKMPTTPKLLVRYKVNSSTLQRAMNRLVKEGYIERSPRRGTFVKHKPQGARIAVFVEENLLSPNAEFGRLLVQQLMESAVSFGWSLEVFDSVGQQTPGHLKQIREDFRKKYLQHPFRGLIQLNVDTNANDITSDADNLYTSGIGPLAGAEGVELDVSHLASTCMANFAQQKVKNVFSLRAKGGIPFGPKEKAALKKEAKAAGIKLTLVELSARDSQETPIAMAFHQATLALKSSKNVGFICNESSIASGIAQAVNAKDTPSPIILVSASTNTPSHLTPTSVYHISPPTIAEAILNRLDEKMHANGIEAPSAVRGTFIPATAKLKAPSDKDLKKSWKA